MTDFRFSVHCELEGWQLFWARLATTPQAESASDELRHYVHQQALGELALAELASHPTVAAIRRLFRAAGCDPTRYRPSSEALLRRVLKGEEIPRIHPLVDLNNCLSIALKIPGCITREDTFEPPVTLRAGREGETYLSLRGPFNLAGKPLLADAAGPFSTPITDSQRGKVTADTRRAWLVLYLPAAQVSSQEAHDLLASWLETTPIATADSIHATP